MAAACYVNVIICISFSTALLEKLHVTLIVPTVLLAAIAGHCLVLCVTSSMCFILDAFERFWESSDKFTCQMKESAHDALYT